MRLSAQVAPAGALLRGSAGLLAFAVTDDSHHATQELSALITLPPGVSFPGGTSGSGASGFTTASSVPASSALASSGSAGSVLAGSASEGWTCGATASGIACTHGSLAAGQTAPGYLRVSVAANAPLGAAPTLTVNSGGRGTVRATGSAGVSATGLPARFAAAGRFDTIMTGNVLSRCASGSAGQRVHCGRERSASAPLHLPGNVVWAGLYWSGSGSPADPALGLLAPGGGYQQVSAASAAVTQLDGGPVYQAYADVTSLIAAGGSGTWRAALPPRAGQRSAATGWTLVVVTSDPAAPAGQTVVLDGAQPAGPGSGLMPLDGLFPPGVSVGMQSAAWAGLRYGTDPALAGWREFLPAARSVTPPPGTAPYLAGVLAATTSADTTQLGPRP